MSNPPRQPLRVFISYASEDDAHRIELEKNLKLLQRQQLIESWSDRKILPGGRWGEEIDTQLENADLIVCLVSTNFLASDYCYDIEMKRALERDAAGEARVVPVIVEDCDWQPSPLGKLHALPDRGKPVTLWDNHANAWTSVSKGLRRLILKLNDALSSGSSVGAAPDPTRYLEALRDKNSYVDIRGMGAQVSERMELRQVYTRLHVSDRGEQRKTKDKQRAGRDKALPGEFHKQDQNPELRDVLADNGRAVLVGDPGSGKTTFLRHVAQHLARTHLGEAEALKAIGLEALPQDDEGVTATPFPIFLRLADVADFLDQEPDDSCPEDAPRHFSRFLQYRFSGNVYGLPPDYLKARLLGGNCYILLDGLDEVPGESRRRRLAKLMENVIVDGVATNRYLLTCRTRAYEGLVRLGSGIATMFLAPLQRAQVQQFCNGWCRALFRLGAAEKETAAVREANEYRDTLLAAIDANPAGHTFTASPLMLTMLAVVHWNKKQLPEQRAELYDSAVEYLLESRQSVAEHETPIRRECLQAIAMAMFADPEGVQRSLGRPEAAASVQGLLGVGTDEAMRFVENEELYSGILMCRIEGEVEFWHLTFQEYLAALELAQDEDGGWQRIQPYLDDDRWSEVVLLLAGCRRRHGGIRAARRMIEKILATGTNRVSSARAVALVSRVLGDILPYGGDPSAGTRYLDMLNDTLGLFEPDGEAVEESVRVEVGEALGRAGDLRLRNEKANRIHVAGGTFLMGAQATDPDLPGYDPEADDDEKPVHEVGLSPVDVGRYCVTVKEYRHFVEAGAKGYLDPHHWNPQGWVWRENHDIRKPEEWADQLDHQNRPVVGVSWYEADAYCRWFGGRLPTEAEWEWIARGKVNRRYPWGDDPPTERHANFGMQVGAPTPVGIYPLDAPDVRDLAGNVWEWCADWFGPYDSEGLPNPTGPETGDYRVLRGGAFHSGSTNLRAAYRHNPHPELRNLGVGFRVVWSLPGGHD